MASLAKSSWINETEIFEHGFLRPSADLDFAHMEVQVDSQAEQVEHQITYLYK